MNGSNPPPPPPGAADEKGSTAGAETCLLVLPAKGSADWNKLATEDFDDCVDDDDAKGSDEPKGSTVEEISEAFAKTDISRGSRSTLPDLTETGAGANEFPAKGSPNGSTDCLLAAGD